MKKSDENPAVAATEAEHPENPLHPLVVTNRCAIGNFHTFLVELLLKIVKEAVMSSSFRGELFFAEKSLGGKRGLFSSCESWQTFRVVVPYKEPTNCLLFLEIDHEDGGNRFRI